MFPKQVLTTLIRSEPAVAVELLGETVSWSLTKRLTPTPRSKFVVCNASVPDAPTVHYVRKGFEVEPFYETKIDAHATDAMYSLFRKISH